MFLNDVLNKCREEGYPVTSSGLYYAGEKYGFLIKKDGCKSLEFDKDKFFEWLKKCKEEVPEGWVPLSKIPALCGISLSKVYQLIKDPSSGAKSFGAGKGVIYADPERIKELVRKCKESHRENW